MRPHLLLVHGYTDSCRGAFGLTGSYSYTTNKTHYSVTQPNDTTTLDYLIAHGGWTRGDITTVGYYSQDYGINSSGASNDFGGDAAPGNCDVNLSRLSAQNSPAAGDAAACDGYWPKPGTFGTTGENLMRLGCRFAWYVYDTYTRNGIPVEIVAHSMGGLIVRSAIGGANPTLAYYPPSPLLVSRVVTVATPHGGFGGIAEVATWWSGQGTQQVADMTPGSTFMTNMGQSQFEKPQGQGGTFWALMGASVPSGPPAATTLQSLGCAGGADVGVDFSLARALSCLAGPQDAVTYPDGDGVVNALSALAMNADVKILYGAVEPWFTTNGRLFVADTHTEYEHETLTCQSIPLGPSATCTHPPFYLNDGTVPSSNDPATYTRAFVCTAQCADTADFADVHLGAPIRAPHSLAEIVSLLVPPPAAAFWTPGHAAHAGDDYPYETIGQFEHTNEGTDAWNEYYGQCDSFAAWKVYQNLAGGAAQTPRTVPAPGWRPSNASISPINQFTWGPKGGPYGNADVWAARFASLGYAVDDKPVPGSVAWWPNALPDPQDGNRPDSVHGIAGSTTGHVGFVTDVYPDGSIRVESYNMRVNGEYSVAYLKYGSGYTDNSFARPNFAIPWPGGFIHVADGAQPGATSPAEPADPGVVQARYPASRLPGLTVIGPGDGGNDVSLTGSAYPNTASGWYQDAGHGEIGQELWTNTHKGAANSTATWSPTLNADACYAVDVFVPDQWSNNDAALYTVTDQHFGTSWVPVNENATTNDWAQLGVFQATGSGALRVTLTDQGAGTGQVAADAMRYVLQPSCSGLIQASQTVGFGNGLDLAGSGSTGIGWTSSSGNGQLGTQYYTLTHGPTTALSATWTAHVIPNDCYQLFAYVPDNHADDVQAVYSIASAAGAVPAVTVDDNAYTNAFAGLGTYRATVNGTIVAILSDQSRKNGDAFIAADTMAFVHASCPGTVEGTSYPSLTEGPGSPLTQFWLTNDWYNRFGHGRLGYEKWTNTHSGTAVSTATWTFGSLPKNTIYLACVFVPDNYANNPSARYQGFQGAGNSAMFTSILDQSTHTGWVPIGVVNTSATATSITLTLDDTGPAGTYTAADAIRLTTARTC